MITECVFRKESEEGDVNTIYRVLKELLLGEKRGKKKSKLSSFNLDVKQRTTPTSNEEK
jgi:hypothetical protein